MSNRNQTRARSNARLGLAANYPRHDMLLDFWPSVVLGTSLAGALWPFTLYLVGLFENAGASSIFLLPIGEMLIAGAVTLLFGGTICLLVTALVAAAIVLAMNLVLSSLRVPCEHLLVATFVGGTVGLVLALPFCFAKDPSYWRCAVMLGLATALTQAGGTWGAWRTLRLSASPTDGLQFVPKAFQFRTRQMFLATVWCAVVLTLLKFAGALTERLLVLVAMWSVVQVALTAVIGIVIKYRQPASSAATLDGDREATP